MPFTVLPLCRNSTLWEAWILLLLLFRTLCSRGDMALNLDPIEDSEPSMARLIDIAATAEVRGVLLTALGLGAGGGRW